MDNHPSVQMETKQQQFHTNDRDTDPLDIKSYTEEDVDNPKVIPLQTVESEADAFEEVEPPKSNNENNNIEDVPETFIDLNVWESIHKDLNEYTEEDMQKLSFKNLDYCIQFYKMYAKVKGFGVRLKGSNISGIDSHATGKKILCNREGWREERHLTRPDRKYKPREQTRCGCPAKIVFKWDSASDRWFVRNFVKEHNHDLVPISQVPFIRSHREITDAQKIRIKSLINSGVKPCITMRNLTQEAGGIRKMTFLTKDLYNTYAKMKREEIKINDAETVMAYLTGKKSADPTFFMNYTRDEENGIDKLFWCDGMSRNDYKAFGRVIAFDTTYKVNAYNKPLVVIAGVNHHRKTVPFAVALITNEKEETYTWVLQQLLEAGKNMIPYTVVTDGDKAMANAIKRVFPNATHRLCLWHLMRNIKGHTNKRFCSGFMKCVDRCRTPQEFEKAWKELVTHYNVQDSRWAIDLYNDREKWAEAYLTGHFFAGMRSTQRCESMNSTLKTVLTRKLLLYKFVELYDQVLEHIRFAEDMDDYTTRHTFPVIDGVLSAVKTHAAKVYTRKSYEMLCKEIYHESRYIVYNSKVERGRPDGAAKTYWLYDSENTKLKYVVIHAIGQNRMFCCCMKIQSIGYPCRHMFAVMKYAGMSEIPAGCILRRWTIRAKEHCSSMGEDEELIKIETEAAAIGRFAFLNGLSNQLCRMAASSYDRSMWLKDRLAKMMLEVHTENEDETSSDLLGIANPQVVGDKGKGNPKKQQKKQPNGKTKNDQDTAELYNYGSVDALSKYLQKYMPTIYSDGEASQAKDCYEVSHFEKIPTVFDWDPKMEY